MATMTRTLLLVGLLVGAPIALASSGDPESVQAAGVELAPELGAPGPVPTVEQARELTRQISRGLRCPVCQGSSIQDSPVDSAVNMRRQVEELVAQGYGQRQIEDYFVARYGEWVLLSPRATGVNWLVWVVPALGGGGALAALVAVAARWRREEDPVPLPSEVGRAPLDDYERRLLEEIER